MATVGIRDLKNRLTQYLRRTKLGEEIVITERGHPIAVIQPIRGVRRAGSLETRLAAAAARGLITLPAGKPSRRVRRVRVRGAPLSRTILEDRR
ncbi:MAG: type II toxin-antitoxin system Phd/YefM family antitoxin [Thermoanaerobaculia bacterium]